MTSRYANEAMIEFVKHRGVDITIEEINFLLNDNYCYTLKLTDQLQTIYSFADVYNSNYRVFPKVTSLRNTAVEKKICFSVISIFHVCFASMGPPHLAESFVTYKTTSKTTSKC